MIRKLLRIILWIAIAFNLLLTAASISMWFDPPAGQDRVGGVFATFFFLLIAAGFFLIDWKVVKPWQPKVRQQPAPRPIAPTAETPADTQGTGIRRSLERMSEALARFQKSMELKTEESQGKSEELRREAEETRMRAKESSRQLKAGVREFLTSASAKASRSEVSGKESSYLQKVIAQCGDRGRVELYVMAHHRDAVRALAAQAPGYTPGPKGGSGALAAWADIIPEPKNSYDPEAVQAHVMGKPVGYFSLEWKDAAHEQLRRNKNKGAQVPVVVRWWNGRAYVWAFSTFADAQGFAAWATAHNRD